MSRPGIFRLFSIEFENAATSCSGAAAGSGTSTGVALLASSTSSAGASQRLGLDGLDLLGGLSDRHRRGLGPVAARPGRRTGLAAVSALLDDVSVLLVSESGTSAPEGAVEVADDSADSLALVDVEVDSGVEAAVLGAVDVTEDCSAVVASAVLGSAGACVCGACSTTGGDCGICGATAVGTSTGACGATTSGSGAVTSGSGATTVVVTPESSPGWANAGAIPPVSAVKEMTTPDANTATTPRFEQSSSWSFHVNRLLRV